MIKKSTYPAKNFPQLTNAANALGIEYDAAIGAHALTYAIWEVINRDNRQVLKIRKIDNLTKRVLDEVQGFDKLIKRINHLRTRMSVIEKMRVLQFQIGNSDDSYVTIPNETGVWHIHNVTDTGMVILKSTSGNESRTIKRGIHPFLKYAEHAPKE